MAERKPSAERKPKQLCSPCTTTTTTLLPTLASLSLLTLLLAAALLTVGAQLVALRSCRWLSRCSTVVIATLLLLLPPPQSQHTLAVICRRSVHVFHVGNFSFYDATSQSQQQHSSNSYVRRHFIAAAARCVCMCMCVSPRVCVPVFMRSVLQQQ